MLQLVVLARSLSGCIVTSGAHLPSAVTETLLLGGCKAVVCRGAEAEDAEEPCEAAAFFSALYKQLQAGRQLVQVSVSSPFEPQGLRQLV